MRPVVTLATWHLYDNTLWDNLSVPAGSDKLLLVKTIEELSSEFGTIYHDPVAVKAQISILSDRFQWGMERDWKALHEDYNPVHNYDRHEILSGQLDSNAKSKDETESKSAVKAFDSTEFVDSDQAVASSGSEGESHSVSHSENHIYGNVGVTESSTMVLHEHDLAVNVEFYHTWATKFIQALCVCIY